MSFYSENAFGILSVILSTVVAVCIARNLSPSKPRGIRTLKSASVKQPFTLMDKSQVSEHVIRLRFSLPSLAHVLGLEIGRHITLSAMIGNPLNSSDPPKYVARQYTPISNDFDDVGYFDLIVKVYRKNDNPKFPQGGWMSQHLDSLPLGATIDVRGPSGRVQYIENGRFLIGGTTFKAQSVAMIAGGTGVTPMYQLIRHLTRDGRCSIKLSLLFGNQHPGDILLRTELESIPDLRLSLTVDRVEPGEEWSGFTGFVDEEMIQLSLPAPSSADLLVFLCGPPPMVRAVETLLANMGYDKTRVHAF